MPEHTRKVGDRGQVTIPKELRERHGIEGGDEVEFVEADEEIRIISFSKEERMAEGYRKHADRSKALAEEMEANRLEWDYLLGTPEWSE